jgi:hypothetical protein
VSIKPPVIRGAVLKFKQRALTLRDKVQLIASNLAKRDEVFNARGRDEEFLLIWAAGELVDIVRRALLQGPLHTVGQRSSRSRNRHGSVDRLLPKLGQVWRTA